MWESARKTQNVIDRENACTEDRIVKVEDAWDGLNMTKRGSL